MTGNTQMVSSLKTYENHFAAFISSGGFQMYDKEGTNVNAQEHQGGQWKAQLLIPLMCLPSLA